MSACEQLATEGCGAIVSFLGITRGTEGDAEVYALEFDAWQERLGPVLERLHEACETYGTLSVAMAHRTGRVEPQESDRQYSRCESTSKRSF